MTNRMIKKNEEDKADLRKYIGIQNSDEKSFGVRFATPKDSKDIIEVMHEGYDYDYLTPEVYREDKLTHHLKDPNELWWVIEETDGSKTPIAVCCAKKISEYSLYIGKTVMKMNFRGKGLINRLGTRVLHKVFIQPEHENLVRLDIDIRASQYNIQVVTDSLGCKPIGFIPNYNNYGDKRNYDPCCGDPFTGGRNEPVILLFSPLKDFWKRRTNKVVLYDHPDIVSFHETIQGTIRKMRKDEVTVLPEFNSSVEEYTVKADYYKSTLQIYGTMQKSSVTHILNTYKKWNVIEWRIPVTEDGVSSQKIAVNEGFIIVGYDPGYRKIGNHLVDHLVMCAFPQGISKCQFDNMDLTKKNRFIVDKVLPTILDKCTD